jgi:hypothetical protein
MARTLWARIGEADAEDAYYAFKHVYLACNPHAELRSCGRWRCAISRTGWQQDAVEAARPERADRRPGGAGGGIGLAPAVPNVEDGPGRKSQVRLGRSARDRLTSRHNSTAERRIGGVSAEPTRIAPAQNPR